MILDLSIRKSLVTEHSLEHYSLPLSEAKILKHFKIYDQEDILRVGLVYCFLYSRQYSLHFPW